MISARFAMLVAAALAVGSVAIAQQDGTVPNSGTVPTQKGDASAMKPADRKLQIVDAVIAGTHAFQIQMAAKAKKDIPEAFGAQGKTPEQLDALIKAQAALLAGDPAEAAKWVDGKPSTFDAKGTVDALLGAGLKLDAKLPVNAAAGAISAMDDKKSFPTENVRALASMIQVILEIDRDGTVLQDIFNFYKPLGLLVGPDDFGIKDSDRAFLSVGKEMADRSCAGPFDTNRAAFQIGLRKIENWKIKLTRDMASEIADKLLKRDDIAPLVPKIKAAKPERILVIGHSFTMEMNWSTLSPMNEIVGAAYRKLNPGVVFTHMGHGGMSATQARNKYLKDGLAWKPTRVLIVTVMGNDAEIAALADMAKAFKAEGAEVIVFDQLYIAANSWINPKKAGLEALAAKGDVTVIEVGKLIESNPNKDQFPCLDGLHMTTPYHELMAGELLKYLLGVRAAKLAP